MKLFVSIIICLSIVVTAEYGTVSKCEQCLIDKEKISEEINSTVVDLTPLTTCAAIGEAIKKATNNTIAGTIVGALCAIVGYEAFKKEYNKTQLNYALYCEVIKDCPNELGDGSIVSVTVNSPLKIGDDIKLKIGFIVKKETGVLEYLFTCPNKTDPTKTKVDKQFEVSAKVGEWEADWEIPTDNWVAGNYACEIKICNTVCDALPKERNFGTKPVKFVIVGQCETCLIDTEKISEEVKSAVVDLTPLTTCAGIGDAIAKATKKPLAGTMAGALCGMIGVEAFKKEFNNTQLNYALYCEYIKDCPNGLGDGRIVSVAVNSPLKIGDDIKLKIGFIVKKETGVLEFLFTCPSKTDTTKNKADKQFEISVQEGEWATYWDIPTDNWVVGNYTCEISLCNSVCDALPKEKKFGKTEVKIEIII